jgi:hypothetical protein
MARNPSEVEQAVSRTLRDSLAKLQQTSGELNQAVNDLVSACASARPSNSLPPMLRARTAAASLSASLEVLSKFVIAALQSAPAREDEELPAAAPRMAAPVASAPSDLIEPVAPAAPAVPAVPAASAPHTLAAAASVERVEAETAAPSLPMEPAPAASSTAELPHAEDAPPSAEPLLAEAVVAHPAAEPQEPEPAPEPMWAPEPTAALVDEELTRVAELSSADLSTSAPSAASYNEELPPEAVGFDVLALTPEERELHRRANRVAKVSMQDIKMLRPLDVASGREHKDICKRLRDDIEKAHKEYDRRFHAILDQPVDYFYDWMVELLGGGDPQTLGEYPYPSPVLRR